MLTLVSTALALVAFAANSVLSRVALRGGAIDAASFSSIRFATGAATLLVVSAVLRAAASGRAESTAGASRTTGGSWTSAAILFVYAVPFSFAYTELPAGTGALILFGSVQMTMMVVALSSGERPRPAQWAGMALALAGLVYLMLPGLEAPHLVAAALMALAGAAWGLYSVRGRGAADPLVLTTGNFVRSVPFMLGVSLIARSRLQMNAEGVLLAMASGSLASGLGYVVWYQALRGLSATQAAVVQLAVPILAGAAGVLFLAEALTGRLIGAAALVLGGIALAIAGRQVR